MKIGVFEINELMPFPPKINPFNEDISRMGTMLSEDVMLMHLNHRDQKLKNAYLVHIPTGQRISISIGEE